MKYDMLRAQAIKNHLLKRMNTTCGNENKCPFHSFLNEFLYIFDVGNLTMTQKKKQVKKLNDRLEQDCEFFFVNMFVEQFDLLFY